VSVLFNPTDDGCMSGHHVYLKAFDYISNAAGDEVFGEHANAPHVLARVKGNEMPRMPMHAPPWPADKVATLSAWIEGGFLP
jgi:hypothetical protein